MPAQFFEKVNEEGGLSECPGVRSWLASQRGECAYPPRGSIPPFLAKLTVAALVRKRRLVDARASKAGPVLKSTATTGVVGCSEYQASPTVIQFPMKVGDAVGAWKRVVRVYGRRGRKPRGSGLGSSPSALAAHRRRGCYRLCNGN